MILFTGGGAFYTAFQQNHACRYMSLRGTDDRTFREALENATAVVHNAANIRCENVMDAVRDNFLPTVRLVNLCGEVNPGVKFVYIGSMSYLSSEHSYLPVGEMSPYAYSKFLAETYCLKSTLPDVCSVRFSTLFYKDPEKDGLSKLIADATRRQAVTIYNGGTARRDFLPLHLAAGYVGKLAQHFTGKKTLNIASARAVSFGEIAIFLKKQIPGLQVSDLPMGTNGREILADFSDEGIRQLGVIPFTLEEEIEKYVAHLQNSKP